ncbi:metal ABC transporter permease [Desulfolutivibrio sulfoxidireducens]|uniref:metal ABC transporter permease n=1 Tax=Desulfolutivibrio sulfoxidireducens TaxID=2773299 RepID=UPI00159D5B67|nr:metal ABC transporter permease [Desulfolutivibrio sulfoxidireducens]QLA17046.1 metal ABC transporter permease [Desulfolutivibrio sulfoxidireducens]
MLEALSFDFMRNALWAGLFASVACGIIGVLVVVNRLVFLAGGVAHAAYGGVGLAFFFGLPVLPTTLGFTVFSALAMGTATLRRAERADTMVGVMWAAGMALGIILIDLTPGYNTDLMSFLFGSILTVPDADIRRMAVMDAVLLGLTLYYYKDLAAMSFDREFSEVRGAPVVFLHYLLLAMTAVSVVMLIRVVGLVLVMALLTIPPYLAERRATSLGAMMLLSALFSVLFCAAGLFFAYRFDLTSGASIIAVAVAFFVVVTLFDAVRARVAGRRLAPDNGDAP